MAKAQAFDDSDIKAFYHELKKQNIERVRALKKKGDLPESLKKIAKQRKKSNSEFLSRYCTIVSVAHNVGEKDFVTFMKTGELTAPVKLSAEDMENLKGGAIGVLSLIGACAGAVWLGIEVGTYIGKHL